MKLIFSYADGGKHPVLGQVFHKRQEVHGDGDVSRYQRYIANALSAVAQDVGDCDRILMYIEAIENEEETKIVVEGNDLDLTLNRTGVQVDIHVNDDWVDQPEGNFKLSEWKAAIIGWRQFLEMPESGESIVEMEL